jgi:hypothetical protein
MVVRALTASMTIDSMLIDPHFIRSQNSTYPIEATKNATVTTIHNKSCIGPPTISSQARFPFGASPAEFVNAVEVQHLAALSRAAGQFSDLHPLPGS